MNNSFKIMALFVTVPSIATMRTIDCEKTALMYAIEAKDISLVAKLINSGADVNAVDGCDQPRMGYPVLRYAIDSGSEAIVRMILEHGANCNMHTTSPIIHADRVRANVRNVPLLSYAIQCYASQQIIELLINYGADVNQKTICNAWTPLMVAAYYGNWFAVKTLLAYGANPTVTNNSDEYRIAYDYAVEMKHKEIMNDLLFSKFPVLAA